MPDDIDKLFDGAVAVAPAPRPIVPANIDVAKQPLVRNPDGSTSTVRSIGIEVDGHHVLIPTVSPDGRVLTNADAVGLYQQTGRHLGIYNSQEDADRAGQLLHESEAQRIPQQHDEIDALFDVPPMVRAPSTTVPANQATMGPPSPQWQAEQDAMAQQEARQEIGAPNLWNNLKAGGKLAALETLAGLHAIGGYESGDPYAEQLNHQAEAALINDPSKLGRFERGTAKFFGNLTPAVAGPAGLALFGLSGGGNTRMAAEDAGASDLAANLAGLGGMGLNVAMPELAGRVAAPLARALGERVANAVPDAVEALFQRATEGAVGGAATGLGLTTGQAAIEATYDPEQAAKTLWSTPAQTAIMALLGAGHGAIGGHPELPVPTLDRGQVALDALNAFDPQTDQVPAGFGSVASGFNAERLAELNAEQQREQAGTATNPAVKQGAPSDVSAPPKENVAPTVPAEPAPIQEQSNGQEIKAQGEAKAPPETDASLLSPEHQPGALVDVRAGKQYLRGEVLSTDAAGKLNVKLATGKILKGVEAYRVVPAKESVTEGIKSENKLNPEIKPETQPTEPKVVIEPPKPTEVGKPRDPASFDENPDVWQRPKEPSTVASAVDAAAGISLWKRQGDAGEVEAHKREFAWHVNELGMTPQEFWNKHGDEIARRTYEKTTDYAAHRKSTPELEGLRSALKDGKSEYEVNEILRNELGIDTSKPAETHVDEAAKAVDTNPTEAQKEAGNYEMGHVKVHGLDITIENPKGSERSGTDANGKPWSVEMPAHYGYVKRTTGADGEHVDVYIGDHPENDRVYVVDQIDAKTGKFDEHKAMMGFASQDEAVKAYDAAFSDGKGPERRGAVTPMPVEAFKRWLGKKRVKPLAYGTKVPVRDSRIANEAAKTAPIPMQGPNREPGADKTQSPLETLPKAIGRTELPRGFVHTIDDPTRTKEAMGALFDAAMHDKQTRRGVVFRVVDKAESEIYRTHGAEIPEGTQLGADTFGISHAIAMHGQGEARADQMPLSRSDIQSIPDAIRPENLSRVEHRRVGPGRHETSIEYHMPLPDGTIAVVSVMRAKRGQLMVINAWKKKAAGTSTASGVSQDQSLGAYSTAPAAEKSLPTKQIDANEEPQRGSTEREAAKPLPRPPAAGAEGNPTDAKPTDKTQQDRLFQKDRIPGEGSTLEMPDPKEGIESLISWAQREREKTIADLKKRVERGGSMADEYRKDLAEHEAVDPEALAKDMREYPQHYLRMMSTKGGSMTPVGVYRNRVQMPPQQPRVQVAALPLSKGQAPDLMAAMRTLRENLKKVAPSAPTFDVDKGALPEGAGGEFDPRTGGINVRYHNDLDAVAHEVGHWASETYKLLPDKTDKETRVELARFAVHGSPAKGELAQREGMAEFLRAWMVSPEEAEVRAPRFAERMREKVPPKVLDALRAYGNDVRRFEGSTALQKMAAGQQRTTEAFKQQRKEGRMLAPLWQWMKDWMGKGVSRPKARPGAIPSNWEASTEAKAAFHASDKEAPQLENYLISAVLAGKNPATMSPSEHWDFQRKAFRGINGKIRAGVMENGLPNIDGTVAKDLVTGDRIALPWLMEPAVRSKKFAEFLDLAHSYGSAQRTIELAERFTSKIESEIGRFAEEQIKEAGGDRLRMPIAEKRVREFAEERRQALRAQLARMTASGGGIHSALEVAHKAIAEMESNPLRPLADEYLRRYRAWSDWNLQYAVDSGLLSPSQAETIRQSNQFYIDWHRVFADEDGPVKLGEAVRGSSRTMHNPLVSLLYATSSTIERGDRNRMMNTFVAPLRMQPVTEGGKSLAQLGRQISQEAADEAATKHYGYHDDGTGQKARVYHVQNLVQEVNADGSPVMDRDGTPLQTVKTEHWVFDPATEASMEAMRPRGGSDLITAISKSLVNVQRMMITSALPFRLRVLSRDNQDQMLNSESGGYGLGDIWRGMRSTFTNPLTREKYNTDEVFHQSGAGMAGRAIRNREQSMADLVAYADDLKKGGWKFLSVGRFLRVWQRFGEWAENVARKREFVSAYRQGIMKLGYNHLDAISYGMSKSRGLLDTAESGHTVAGVNPVALFMNASLKGTERMAKPILDAAKAAREKNWKAVAVHLGRFSTRWATVASAYAGIRMWQLSQASDDKQEEMMEQPAYKRDFAIQIDAPGLGKVAIPKPYEWGVLGSGVERFADSQWASAKAAAARANGDEAAALRWDGHAKNAWDEYAHSSMSALNPLKPEDAMSGGFTGLVEVFANHSLFRDSPIIPQNEVNEKLSLRKRAADASPVGRGLSDVFAPMIGDRLGDPRSIEHILQSYGGGWGSVATARNLDEVMRRVSGYSGETSPYAERDVAYVLDWASKEGVDSRKPFAQLRQLIKSANEAPEGERDEKLVNMRRRAMSLRRQIENNPRSLTKRPVTPDEE